MADVDAFDSRDFYELMQAYRWSALTDPASTVAAFEAVKAFCRDAVDQAKADEADSCRDFYERNHV